MKRNLQNDSSPVAGPSGLCKNKRSNIVSNDQSLHFDMVSPKVICLSDSDEEIVLSTKKKISPACRKKMNVELESRAVGFYCGTNTPSTSFAKYDEPSTSKIKSVNNNNSVGNGSISKRLSSKLYSRDKAVAGKKSACGGRTVKDDSPPIICRNIFARKDMLKMKSKIQTKSTRELFSDEENILKKKKEPLVKAKNRKAVETLKRKNIQPGECMKFIHVHIDKKLKSSKFNLDDILNVLTYSNISYTIDHQSIPESITWTRRVEKYYTNDNSEICTDVENQVEKQLMIIWNFDVVLRRVWEGTFVSEVSNLASRAPGLKKTLIMYGMNKYFLNRSASSKRSKGDGPNITRDELENCRLEIQMVLDCNSLLIDTPKDMAMLVHQYTKAIAEIPFKVDQMKRVGDKTNWYAQGDNRNTVKVDQNGYGLKRLWQQQLCQFPLVTLEIADAITSVYPSPAKLMQTYFNCTRAKGECLLKDIPIRRAAGPLTTARKIGPELSKKIYVMFTSEDGEVTLGNNEHKL